MDARLSRLAAKRDERAFEAIFRRYHQEIYRYCLAILGNAEDARDALQNTMVKALQALPGEDREIQLRPWLYRVAHNEAVELVRRRGATAPIDAELEDPADGFANAVATRERLRQLLHDLAELPERQRAALVMRELSGLEFAQIGEFFDTSEDAARQTVYEARLSLRSLEAGREMTCEDVKQRLSSADGRTGRRRDLRAHLRICPDCSAFRDSIEERKSDFASIAPLPALASAGLLHALLGSAQGAVGGTAATGGGATVGGGAGKALTAGFVAKSVATVAVVAAVGVSAADRGGLIHTGLSGGSSSTPAGQESGAAGAPTEGGSAAGAEAAARRRAAAAKAKAKRKREARAAKARRARGRGAAGVLPPASQRGQETAAAHRKGAAAGSGRGRSSGAAHGRSHRSSHGRGHAKAPARPSAPPAESKSSSPQGAGGKGSTGETTPKTEQSSGSGSQKSGSGTNSEGMP